MLERIKRDSAIIFAAGAAAAYGANKILKSKAVRNLTVKAVSNGLKFKEDVEHQIASIKEDAEDVLAEAKTEAGINDFPENTEEKQEA
ncbi:MAG: DUF6110 family protein [Lachnospirales bacterium]